ncbi:MAG: GDP-mannose 4,6-dehydratase, partial [Candidatus Desantisbacteria bacterium]
MWLMMQQQKPDDYVIGTGESHSVKEFVIEAFSYVGLDWEKYVRIDPRYFRPLELEVLMADASKARRELGWEPQVTFKELVRIMVDADMEGMGLKSPAEGKAILIKYKLNIVDRALTNPTGGMER